MFPNLPAVRADLVAGDGATCSEEEESTAIHTCRATCHILFFMMSKYTVYRNFWLVVEKGTRSSHPKNYNVDVKGNQKLHCFSIFSKQRYVQRLRMEIMYPSLKYT
jgi:hypothetical protein